MMIFYHQQALITVKNTHKTAQNEKTHLILHTPPPYGTMHTDRAG